MKATKKILSLLLVAMLVMALSVSAFAAGEGSITIDNASEGVDYTLYRIFDATVNASGTSASYTVNSQWVPFFTGAGAGYLTATGTGNTVTLNGQTRYINITDANVVDFAKAAADWAAPQASLAVTHKAATGASVSFTGLDLGYYMIFPKGATDPNSYYQGTVVTLDTTMPSATVHTKANTTGGGGDDPDDPPFDKTSNDVKIQNGQVGDKVPFKITGVVPATEGYSQFVYRVTDTMSPGLTFNASVANFKVTFGTTTINKAPTYANNGFTLEFDMTQYQQYVGQAISITYEAVINEQAVAQTTKNEAKLVYSNDPANSNSTKEKPSDPNDPPVVNVTTSEIVINKTDGTSDEPLAGAVFSLKNSQNQYYKLDTVNGQPTVTWVAKAQADKKTTDADGVAKFVGLKDGEYKLEEITAPAGYNKLTSDVTVTVSAGTATVGESKVAPVENNAGTELPSTGGIGTTIFYVLGSCLLIGAAVLLITRKRMKSEG